MKNGQALEKMSVREVMKRYPRTRSVFDRFGLLGCGGEEGPDEPVEFFARVHRVPIDDLLTELTMNIDEENPELERSIPREEKESLFYIYRSFINAATILFLTGGATAGAVYLMIIGFYGSFDLAEHFPWWQALIQSHGHIQLFGWVGLFIMGVSYHVVPRFIGVELQRKDLAVASFYLMLAGILLRGYFQPFSADQVLAHWVIIGSALEVVSVLIFLSIIISLSRSSAKGFQLHSKYLTLGAVYFLISAALLLGLAIYQALEGLTIPPQNLNDVFLHITLVGFITHFILGVAFNAIPMLMGHKEPHTKGGSAALYLLNSGLVLFVLGLLFRTYPVGRLLLPIGAGFESLSFILYLSAINIFRKRAFDLEPGMPISWERFVKVAFLWFAAASLGLFALSLSETMTGTPAPHAFIGSYRHAITVGFITMMIFGMAYRILPVFEGKRLYSENLVLWSFVLLNLGNFGRVAFELLVGIFGGPFFPIMGMTGTLEVTAGALFGLNIWRTIYGSRRKETDIRKEFEAVSVKGLKATDDWVPLEKMTIYNVLTNHPDLLSVFVENGLEHLKDPAIVKTMGRIVTVETACRRHNILVETFVQQLREKISQS